ncbi:hypothetical protein RM780_06885 [Streptomyces sp. DSM 44917]|uniref:Uncharacterized protein n=1 Tax=Streptomyces boetiae TaxID=3075541 RepID=A0ABU2L559_9ACTN|nr:hypothetical protein [Streptomyces sp. DSM 44917]MDT0306685.1 hypothetical protein [Streptomyces sp. DSM 44917]
MSVSGSPTPPPPPPSAPPPPAYPPSAGRPRDARTAATAALLNLSGLGAGYLYLRRRSRAVLCWVATGTLLLAVLPPDADGIPGPWAALYAAALVLFALDGWRLGRPPVLGGHSRAWLPVTAGVLLLSLPAGSVLLFENARREALESDLRDRLAAADAEVERAGARPFGEARDLYRSAVDAYVAVRREHPDTRAAGTVRGRLDDLYAAATAPGGETAGRDRCAALSPLRFFQSLPGEVEDAEARRLAERAAGDLPGPLHDCGLQRIAASDPASAAQPLTELLGDHAGSDEAAGLPAELDARQRASLDALSGETPCPGLDDLRALNRLLAELPGEEFATLTAEGREAEPEGLYQCGRFGFLNGQYANAETLLRDLVDNHPGHDRGEHAADILIAARIAQELPAAGEELPPDGDAGGGPVTLRILNDSPYEREILYTGPDTGSRTLAACEGCETYASDPGDGACSDSGVDYPSLTLRLPAGRYYFLHRSIGADTTPVARPDDLRTEFVYTYCSFVTREGPSLPDIPGLPEV